jgi:dTDP-4-dehydrorhamnose 3,5-epimerase
MPPRLIAHPTPIADLMIIERTPSIDERGSLQRLFCLDEMRAIGWLSSVAQINLTHTLRRGTVRGMHYQVKPYAEAKLVTCLRGEVYDVAVDLRARRATFLQWYAIELSSETPQGLLIPPGFAHGLQTLTDDVEMLYVHSAHYNAEFERGVSPRDERIQIKWPIPISLLSTRDAHLPPLAKSFEGLEV